MNQAFIYLELAEQGSVVPYEKSILTWVKTSWPETTVLDLDSLSENLLYAYAERLLTEADNCIIYFRSSDEAPMDKAATLVEQLIKMHQKILVLLQGQHVFLERLFTSRPEIRFRQAGSEEELKAEIAGFLNSAQA